MPGATTVIKSLLFDLDDTLYEEKQFVMSGFKVVSQYISKVYNINYNEIFKILQTDFRMGLRQKNFNVLLKKLNLKDERMENLVKIYREHSPKIFLYSDARFILKRLKRKFKLGLITDGYSITQRNKISALNIGTYFDIITINDISKNQKKDVKAFSECLSILKVKPKNAIYVGDNPLKDFINAKRLGVFTVRIKRKKGIYDEASVDNAYEAEYVISNLLKLPNIINKINK